MQAPDVWLETDLTGRHYKLMYRHVCNEGRIVLHSLPQAIWEITTVDPLTVRQRINCGICGLVGFFRRGVWEPNTPTG